MSSREHCVKNIRGVRMSTDGWTQRALRFASVGWSSPPVTGSDGCRLGR